MIFFPRGTEIESVREHLDIGGNEKLAVISDNHLGDSPDRYEPYIHFLSGELGSYNHIFWLGDLFDEWDNDTESALKIFSLIKEHLPYSIHNYVYVNHDPKVRFWGGEDEKLTEIGVRTRAHILTVQAGRNLMRMEHGDRMAPPMHERIPVPKFDFFGRTASKFEGGLLKRLALVLPSLKLTSSNQVIKNWMMKHPDDLAPNAAHIFGHTHELEVNPGFTMGGLINGFYNSGSASGLSIDRRVNYLSIENGEISSHSPFLPLNVILPWG